MTLVYHRIPECGGDSITPWLDKWLGRRAKSLVVGHSADLASLGETELLKIALVSGPFGTEFWPQFQQPVTAVMILRDPVDRIVSLYSRWHSAPAGSNLRELARRGDIYQFARDPHVLVTEFVDNAQTWALFADPATKSRSARKKFTAEQILGGALDRLDSLAAVGIYERWDDTVAHFASLLGEVFGEPPPLPEQPFEKLDDDLAQVDRERLAAALGSRITLDMKLHRLVSDRLDMAVQVAAHDRRKAILGEALGGSSESVLDPVSNYLFSRVDVLETMLAKSEATIRDLVRELERSRSGHRAALAALAAAQEQQSALKEAFAILQKRHAAATESLARIKAKAGGPGSDSKSASPAAG